MAKESPKKAETDHKVFPSSEGKSFVTEDICILVGGGGGITWRFTDFVIGKQGETLLSYYMINPDTEEKTDVQVAPFLLNNRSSEFERLIEIALEIDFFGLELDPPQSTMLRHTAVAHPEFGSNKVVWSVGAVPVPPGPLVKFDQEVRRFLIESFKDEYER